MLISSNSLWLTTDVNKDICSYFVPPIAKENIMYAIIGYTKNDQERQFMKEELKMGVQKLSIKTLLEPVK